MSAGWGAPDSESSRRFPRKYLQITHRKSAHGGVQLEAASYRTFSVVHCVSYTEWRYGKMYSMERADKIEKKNSHENGQQQQRTGVSGIGIPPSPEGVACVVTCVVGVKAVRPEGICVAASSRSAPAIVRIVVGAEPEADAQPVGSSAAASGVPVAPRFRAPTVRDEDGARCNRRPYVSRPHCYHDCLKASQPPLPLFLPLCLCVSASSKLRPRIRFAGRYFIFSSSSISISRRSSFGFPCESFGFRYFQY